MQKKLELFVKLILKFESLIFTILLLKEGREGKRELGMIKLHHFSQIYYLPMICKRDRIFKKLLICDRVF